MSQETVLAERRDVWGAFAAVRGHLYDQFKTVCHDPETGLSPEDLEGEVEAWLVAHPDAPRVEQKANVFRIVVTRGRICVDPLDWFADKLQHGNLVRKLRDRWFHEATSGPIREEAQWFDFAWRLGILSGGIDLGHISPGWENMFRGGLRGLIEKARACRRHLGDRATPGQIAFYDAVETVYEATIQFALRLSAQAAKMAETNPEHRARMRAVAEACSRVPAHRPRTFHEALQFAFLMHELIEMEGEWVRSMGHFDRVMYPYYEADIEAGRLTPAQARELIQFFWIKWHARTRGRDNGKNFLFGGQYADGSDVTNDLTYLALDAYEELNAPDPKLSVRFFPGSPDQLYRRVADLIRKGHNAFVLMNDQPAVEGLVRMGKTLEDARLYLPIGCYEPAVDGKEAACTMNMTVNLAKGVELALNNGVDPMSGERAGPETGDPREFASFEDLFAAYKTQMDFILTRATDYIKAHERQWPAINPSALIAGTIEDCLATGRDVGQGGPRYNSVGCVGASLANTCDSLLALKKTVFEEKRFTMDEMLEALRSDFAGREPMRQYLLNRVPKWGNNDPEADALARQIADYYCDKIHSFRNARGGRMQAALFTLTYRIPFGEATGALPDGRKAGVCLAPGVGAMTGLDRNGVTALMNSVCKLDFTKTPNGSALDIMLHPTAVEGEEGLTALAALIRAFFARGGYALQFNVVDAETLRKAQRHPEEYANLQIRVTGWSVYFNALSRDEQEHFIHRVTHGV